MTPPSAVIPKMHQSSQDLLQASIARWKTKGDNAEDVIANCAFALKMANENFYKPANIPLPFDPGILFEIIDKDKGVNRTLDVNHKHRVTGVVVEFLILFGCIPNQAMLALAEWNKESKNTVRTGHTMAMQGEINGDTIGFFFRNLAIAESFIEKTKNRPFPFFGSYPQAQAAFEKLCQAYANEKVKQAYRLAITQAEYNYKEIYEVLIRIHPNIGKHGKFDHSRV